MKYAEGRTGIAEKRLKRDKLHFSMCPCLLPQSSARAEDPYFHEVLYATLIDARASRQLLQLDSPALERWLRGQGGLDAAQPGIPIGPLQPGQVGVLLVA